MPSGAEIVEGARRLRQAGNHSSDDQYSGENDGDQGSPRRDSPGVGLHASCEQCPHRPVRLQFQDARLNTEMPGIYSNRERSPLRTDEYVDVRTLTGQKAA